MRTAGEVAVTDVDEISGRGLWRRIDRTDLGRAVFVAVCATVVALTPAWPWSSVPVVAVVGLVVGCQPVLREAFEDIRHRRMSMELSMVIAIAAAAAIGEWTTALVITTFVLVAEILEDLSMDRGRDALSDLMSFLPERVQVRRASGIVTEPLAAVVEGDVVVVGPGGRIPVDGTVIGGRSTADQSRITGEPLPVDLGVGDDVFAGSINRIGAIEVRAERIGGDSSYGRIVAAVTHAQSSEPPVQRLADRLAAWLVYLALAGAAVTFVTTRDITATISVVVVAGACGVAAGTPLAVLAAIARIARSGAFVKDGAHLEALSTVDTVVFDKTGTLTTGGVSVVGVQVADGWEPDSVLTLAAAAETYSEHPLGRAVMAFARERSLPTGTCEEFVYVPGQGVTAIVANRSVAAGNRALVTDAPDTVAGQGTATMVHVGVDGRYAGTILLADTIRPSAKEAVALIHQRGMRTMIITGDQARTADAVAAELGIGDVRAGLLPEEKLAAIDTERASGHRLAMVGDGVNDAPALARAQVGIAMGSGTDIARESADVLLISSDLNDLVRTLRVARWARRIILVNFVGTIAVDLVGMGLAAAGHLSPVLAALVHVGSETAFILNSARLIPGGRTRSVDG